MSFSKEEERSIKECFTLYDRDGDGAIDKKEVGTVARSLGYTPTELQVENALNAVVGGRESRVGFSQFCGVLSKLKTEGQISEDNLREAFKVFDRESNGFVNAAELRHVMTNLGEKLSDEEMDEMIRAIQVEVDGSCNYEPWVQMMLPNH